MRKNVRVVRASLLPTLHSVLVLTFFLFELNSLLIIRSTGSSLNSSLELRPPARILLRRLTFYPTPREREREREIISIGPPIQKYPFLPSSFARVIHPWIGSIEEIQLLGRYGKSCRFLLPGFLLFFRRVIVL